MDGTLVGSSDGNEVPTVVLGKADDDNEGKLVDGVVDGTVVTIGNSDGDEEPNVVGKLVDGPTEVAGRLVVAVPDGTFVGKSDGDPFQRRQRALDLLPRFA